MKKILVITRENDLHADFVIHKIRSYGGDVIRLNTETITSNLSYTFTDVGESTSNLIEISDSNITFSTDSYQTIWYRKPLPVDVAKAHGNKDLSDFINSEHNIFISEFYEINRKKKWVNDIWSMKRADFKLVNLTTAHTLGFKIPKTIVTNRILDAEAFAAANNWKVLVKAFRAKGITHESKPYVLYSNVVNKENFEKFKDGISLCPTILQQYIEKKLELRVTVVGNCIFTAAIHSQEDPSTLYDYRAGDTFKLKHTVYQLPEQVSNAILRFNRHYGLSFSTFDIILTPSNEFVFLECNPNGQWYWIEELTNMPIAAAIAELLLVQL